MGSRLKDLAAGPVAMIGAALERAPSSLTEAPGKAIEALKKAGPELPARLDKVRDALPGGRKKTTKLRRLKRIVEGAGTVVSVAVTGWEMYELVRARSETKTGSPGSRNSTKRKSGSRRTSGARKSTSRRSGSSRSTSPRSGAKRGSTSRTATRTRSSSRGRKSAPSRSSSPKKAA